MAAFYHTISIILLYAGSSFAATVVPEYAPPQIPVSILLAIAAGPFEETVFFGIPFYLTSNPYVVLASASVWSFAHIFSTTAINPNNLAYGSFFFTIPHIFFGLRTWISGKGWFAVTFHSAWNVSILLSYCAMGIRSCVGIGTGREFIGDVLTTLAAISSVLFVYQIYKARTKKINKPITFGIILVLGISIVLLSATNVSLLF